MMTQSSQLELDLPSLTQPSPMHSSDITVPSQRTLPNLNSSMRVDNNYSIKN